MKYTVTPANVFESIWHISILPEYPNDQGRARTITISARKPDLIDWLDHSIEEWGRSLERDDPRAIYTTRSNICTLICSGPVNRSPPSH